MEFYLKRPDSDFVGRNRSNAQLTRSALLNSWPTMRPDIDNLVKFVLDSLNGVVYHDDRQVVKVVAYKMRDNDGYCNGRTVVEIKPFVPEDI